jgi:Asp-tRNA(Asn)/Glu-tRNA(Gln) amidotransferase A subunit family amidase
LWDAAAPPTAAALDAARAALERAGSPVVETVIAPEHEGLNAAHDTIMRYEMAASLADERIAHAAQLSPRLAQILDAGLATSATDYDAAIARREVARAQLDGFFGDCDAMLVPAAPGEAPSGLGNTGDPVFNRMWTLLGVPCATLPARWATTGLPTGVQLVGRVRDDARLLACALFLEAALARQ